MANEKGIELREIEVSLYEAKKTWFNLKKFFWNTFDSEAECFIDISTMPRDIIWKTLNLLYESKLDINYLYYTPDYKLTEPYDKKWLSRDPGKPRLIYKLSGIMEYGEKTILIIITGYDVDRVKQLIRYFEPHTTYLGIQTGDQFDNEKENKDKFEGEFRNRESIISFNLDAYSEGHGCNEIEVVIKDNADANILMTSLGPKLSSIPLFLLKKKYLNTALVYGPSNEYNPEYSHGIGDLTQGIIKAD